MSSPLVGRPGKLAGLPVDRRNQRGIELSLRYFRRNRIEPPRGSREDAVIGIDDVGIAVGQGDRKVGIHVHDEVSGDEVVVPEVVGIEEADERRVELRQAAPDRTALPDIRLELDIAEARVIQPGKALPDRLVGSVGRGIVDDDDPDVANGLARDRFDGLADKVAVVVIGDNHANSGS